MTKDLFREDSYLRSCDATITEINELNGIILDQTVFYPTGGGQPGDTGILKTVDGKEITIATTVKSKENGGIFGEMALMDNSPRMATAVADEPTVVISIPEETVKKKLSKSNPVTKMMLMVMIRMLRSMSHDVELKPIKVDNIPHLKNHLFNE